LALKRTAKPPFITLIIYMPPKGGTPHVLYGALLFLPVHSLGWYSITTRLLVEIIVTKTTTHYSALNSIKLSRDSWLVPITRGERVQRTHWSQKWQWLSITSEEDPSLP
jgi:hypothetical protein